MLLHSNNHSKGASRSPFSLLATPAKHTLIAYWVSVAISLAWLLPNHYQPWIAFHSDFYIATALWGILAWCIFSNWSGPSIPVSSSALLFLLLSAFCCLQYFVGVTYFHGQAVITATYFFAGFLAILLGAQFAANQTRLQRKLFVAFLCSMLCAGIASVGISLYQFFGLSYLGVWVVVPSMSDRYAANIGQPNQLATLISCAFCVSLWLYERRALSWRVFLALGLWLLTGAMLAQSRTGYLQLMLIAVVWCFASSRATIARKAACISLFMAFALAFPWALQVLASAVDFARLIEPRALRVDPIRIALWKVMAQAALERPWLGYGMSNFYEAYWVASLNVSALEHLLLGHAHNIFIDLAIWFGIPVAGMVMLGMFFWIKKALFKSTGRSHIWLLTILMVMLLHALLELPLHYAYFLLPFLVIVGYLEYRCAFVFVKIRRAVVGTVLAFAGVLGGVIWVDYMDAEEAFSIFKFELANIGQLPDAEPTQALLITQWQLVIASARMNVNAIQSEQDAQLLIAATRLQPAPLFFLRSAQVLAGRGNYAAAELELGYGCRVSPAVGCDALIRAWKAIQKQKPEYLKIAAPSRRPD